MLFDLRIVAIAASFILASIAVAAAGDAQPQTPRAPAGATESAADARPIRVVLPAPWEPASTPSGAPTLVQK